MANKSVIEEFGMFSQIPYFILRFNAFKAHHDINAFGLNLDQKKELVSLLAQYGRVYITTEGELDDSFKEYQLKIRPDKIHHVLAYATMFIGDSQTMTSEAAILGTPALKCNTFAGKLSIPNELENKYELNYAYQPEEFESLLLKIKVLLSISDLKDLWAHRRKLMLLDKIDVTKFLYWFVVNYPCSKKKLQLSKDFNFLEFSE